MIIFHFLQTNIFGIVTSNLIVIHMLFFYRRKSDQIKISVSGIVHKAESVD